ncbi:MAG: addiction module protein [Deltaproteobacteria bacterium]|nr:addiction module protein [Deltaproteobacteria bacterium]MCW5803281.1 addiction module protein [Deltaproteobacteria bacterium]
MSRSVAEVFDDALSLGEDDRARLLARLIESLDGPADPDTSAAWEAEVQGRLDRIDAGEATFHSKEESIARLREAARRR